MKASFRFESQATRQGKKGSFAKSKMCKKWGFVFHAAKEADGKACYKVTVRRKKHIRNLLQEAQAYFPSQMYVSLKTFRLAAAGFSPRMLLQMQICGEKEICRADTFHIAINGREKKVSDLSSIILWQEPRQKTRKDIERSEVIS